MSEQAKGPKGMSPNREINYLDKATNMRTIRTLLSKINVVMPVVAGGLPPYLPLEDLRGRRPRLSTFFNFLEAVHDFFHFSDSERDLLPKLHLPTRNRAHDFSKPVFLSQLPDWMF